MPEPSSPYLRVASTELSQTTVAASLHVALEPKKNALCAATFSLAWRALEKHVGGPAEVEGLPSFASAVRSAGCAPGDIDEAAYIAEVADGPKGLTRLKAELSTKMGADAAPRLLPASLPPDTLFVYSYLFKHLALVTPLARDTNGELYFHKRAVQSFGVWDTGDSKLWEKRADQVKVHDHLSDEDFVIELTTRKVDDRLILARVPPGPTLLSTIQSVLQRAPDELPFLKRVFGGVKLKKGEKLQVPVLDFEITHHFAEIENRNVLPLNRPLVRAEQLVRLRLDEYGALLKSEVALELPKSRAAKIRSFVFDGPFLVVMMRRGSNLPYFALWVATPELLIPVE